MITVLLSVFNGELWLRECIESILNQTYKDFEFLIINDGSNDGTLSIIKEYAKTDKRIKYISHENIGLTASLNIGLDAAKGEWIARIDSDDIARRRRLELQLNYVLREKVGLVGCQGKIIDSNGKIKSNIFVPTKNDQIYSNLKRQKKFFSHSSVFFNKRLVVNLGGYKNTMKFSQDYDLWLRISEVSKLSCLKYVGVYLRQHNRRVSDKDKGIEQRIYGHCANISHILRIENGNIYDPLIEEKSEDFLYFHAFVKKNLKESNTLYFYEKIYDFKRNLGRVNFFKKIVFIPFYFNNIDLAIKLIKWILIGDFISKNISRKWLELKMRRATN